MILGLKLTETCGVPSFEIESNCAVAMKKFNDVGIDLSHLRVFTKMFKEDGGDVEHGVWRYYCKDGDLSLMYYH